MGTITLLRTGEIIKRVGYKENFTFETEELKELIHDQSNTAILQITSKFDVFGGLKRKADYKMKTN